MAADAGIFQQYLNPVRSLADYRGDLDKQEQNALTLAAGRLSNQTSQQALADDQTARQAWAESGGDPTKALNALQKAGLFKQAQAAQKGMLENQESQAKIAHFGAQTAEAGQKTASSRSEAIGQTLGALSKIEGGATPEHVTRAMQHMVDIGQISPEMAQKIVAGAPADPSQMQGWLLQGQRAVLGVKDQLPKFQAIDTGGAVNTGTVDPVTGAFTPANSMSKTQTPDSAATDARMKSEGVLNRANQIKVQTMIGDRQDAKGNAEPTLSEETRARIAKQFLKGDKSGLQNLGRGAQGSANLVAIQNDITAEAARQGMSGEAIAARMAEYGGLVAGMRTSGTISARIENAAAEAVELVPLALAASKNVVRSGFLPFGKAGVMFDTNSNNPAMAEFATANLGLATAYASAMARGNKPTVSDMEHSRELLSTAKNDVAYEATVRQMQREIAAAQRAPKSVRQGLSDEIAGKGGHGAPAAPAIPSGWSFKEH